MSSNSRWAIRATTSTWPRSSPQARTSRSTERRRSSSGVGVGRSASPSASSTAPSRSPHSECTRRLAPSAPAALVRIQPPAGRSSARRSSTPGTRRRSASESDASSRVRSRSSDTVTSYWLSEAGGVPHRRAARTRARAPAVPPLATQRAGSASATSCDERGHRLLDRGPHRLAFVPRRRVVGDEQAGHPPGADRQAAPPPEPLGTRERDLEAPAAEVEQQRRTLPERDARRHPREREASLLAAVDEPHLGPDRALEQRRQRVAIGAVAEGARRERDDVIRPHAHREIGSGVARSRRRVPRRRRGSGLRRRAPGRGSARRGRAARG